MKSLFFSFNFITRCVVFSTKRMNETLISSSDDIALSLRCLMAAVHSSLTSTRQRTPSTARRDWRSLQTDTSWLPILATTASKSTATCSSHSTQSLYSVHMYKHAVVRSNWKFFALPLPHLFTLESCCHCAICLTFLPPQTNTRDFISGAREAR